MPSSIIRWEHCKFSIRISIWSKRLWRTRTGAGTEWKSGCSTLLCKEHTASSQYGFQFPRRAPLLNLKIPNWQTQFQIKPSNAENIYLFPAESCRPNLKSFLWPKPLIGRVEFYLSSKTQTPHLWKVQLEPSLWENISESTAEPPCSEWNPHILNQLSTASPPFLEIFP